LVIHQPFLRERQRFHNGSCFVLGLRLDQEDDTFAIAARIPLTDFPGSSRRAIRSRGQM
jgi:hypothetical protein